MGTSMDSPSRRIALQVFALALQVPGSDLCCCRLMLARVMHILETSQRNVWAQEMRILLDPRNPFSVLGHGDRASLEVFESADSRIGLTLQNASVRIVCLLNLANYNRLELASGTFEVEVGSVQVVLFFDLPLYLLLDLESLNERVMLANRRGRVMRRRVESLLVGLNGSASTVLLLVDIVLEVAGQGLDLLDLLGQVIAKSLQLVDDVCLDVLCLVRFVDGVLVVVAENVVRFIDATG